MENKRGRPKRLKPSIKRLIVSRAIAHRKIPREYLANELIKEIDAFFMNNSFKLLNCLYFL